MLGILFGFCYIEFIEDLRNNKPDKAAEEWKKLCAKIEEYLLFCNEINSGDIAQVVRDYGEKLQKIWGIIQGSGLKKETVYAWSVKRLV